MRRSLRTLAVAAVGLGLTVQAFAHHSTSYYSREQKDFVKILREGITKDSIAAGDQVTVEGFPIPGQLFAWLGKVTARHERNQDAAL